MYPGAHACAPRTPFSTVRRSESETMMKTRSQLQQDVQEELAFNPAVDASGIGVAVKGNVVVLTGFVKSYFEKIDAERSARQVAGAGAIANEIVVRPWG